MNKLSTYLFLVLFASCSSQNDRIETKLMECYYESFSDKGIELKQLIFEYENLLIKEGFLKDNSGDSYISFLQNFANQKETIKTPSKLFCLENQKIKQSDSKKNLECRKTILSDSSGYDDSKLIGVKKAVVDNAKPYNVAKDMLKVLSKEDFEIPVQKLF